MPGVQVLFAFLLILPFQNRFERLTSQQEYVYYAALLCATAAIVLLIAPTAAHRIRWRQAGQGGAPGHVDDGRRSSRPSLSRQP